MQRKGLWIWCYIGIVGCVFGYPATVFSSIQRIFLKYNGNVEARVWTDPGQGPRHRVPAIVYVYDEFLDRVGEPRAIQEGYSVNQHILAFSRWDVVVIVPMERYRRLNAVQGAIQYARKMPEVDPNRIHIVGISEGAVIGLAAAQSTRVRSVTAITPLEINDKGVYSYLHYASGRLLTTPIMLMSSEYDKHWEKLDNRRLRWFFKTNRQFEHRIYLQDRVGFWDPTRSFMWDIRNFIYRNGGVSIHESTNPRQSF
ncbi:hypothetical protein EB093_01910 [bacterium]|nr:hypothetical protein [bacterium]